MIKLGLKNLLMMIVLVPIMLLLGGCPLSGGVSSVKIRDYKDAYVTYQAVSKSVAETANTLAQTGALDKGQVTSIIDKLKTVRDHVEATKQYQNLNDINVQIQILMDLSAELNAKAAAAKQRSSGVTELFPAQA